MIAAHLEGQMCNTCQCQSVCFCAVVISWKLSKINRSYYETLYQSLHSWFCCCILWFVSFILMSIKYAHILIWPPIQLWHQTTAIDNRAQLLSHCRCWQLLSTKFDRHDLFCLESLSVVWHDVIVKQEAGQLLNTVSTFLYFGCI